MGKFQEPLTLHVYLYCINDPVNKIDPSGRIFWNLFGALTAGTAVRSAATIVMVAGIKYDNTLVFEAGLDMHHFVAPAMFVGAILGPALPVAGELAIGSLVDAWQGLTVAATRISGPAYVVAREISWYAIRHPYQLANAADAISVFCADTMMFDTPAGYGAQILKVYIDNFLNNW